MKINITHLSIEEQATLTARILKQRLDAGQKVTHADDLLSYFKHRGFRKHRAQFVTHCSTLLRLGTLLATGKDSTKAFKEARANAITYQPGDRVLIGNESARVVDVLPDRKLRILSLAGPRVVRAIDVTPDRQESSAEVLTIDNA